MRCTDARKYGVFAYYFQGYVIQTEFCWKKGGLKLAFTAENLYFYS